MRSRWMQQFTKSAVKFCRLRLGLKPLFDPCHRRHRLNGLTDLQIHTIFDVGANVGKFSRMYRRRFPEATIHCVEPLPCCHSKLQKWTDRDGKAALWRCALGSTPGRTTIRWNLDHWGGSTLVKFEDCGARFEEVSVEVETLDRLAARVAANDDILIKLDVEGFELEVMRGGQETLRRAKAIVVEVATGETDRRPVFADIVAFLGGLGYVYHGNLGYAYVRGVPHLADAVFIRCPAVSPQTTPKADRFNDALVGFPERPACLAAR